MAKQVYVAAELIAAAKAYIAEDAALMSRRPAGMPRIAWRMEHPSSVAIDFNAKLGRADVRLQFNPDGNPYDLWVWSRGAKAKLIEQIDLRAADADERLSRYERV